jgi:SAM-dependent methyltransferase
MVEKRYTPNADYCSQVKTRGCGFDRLDGVADLYPRMRGAKVFDVGCNRGAVSYDAARAGARLVHGCDIDVGGLRAARDLFADLRDVESCFEACDLTKGPSALKLFAGMTYDITLCLATYHKLKRVMAPADLTALVRHFGATTTGWFAWRGTSDKANENDAEIDALDRDLGAEGFVRIHTSHISEELGIAAIWARG